MHRPRLSAFLLASSAVLFLAVSGFRVTLSRDLPATSNLRLVAIVVGVVGVIKFSLEGATSDQTNVRPWPLAAALNQVICFGQTAAIGESRRSAWLRSQPQSRRRSKSGWCVGVRLNANLWRVLVCRANLCLKISFRAYRESRPSVPSKGRGRPETP